jgi:RND superfamily putative drug exporter
MFERLGSLVLRFRFLFAAIWFVGAVAFGLLGPSLAAVGSADETSFLPKDAESMVARNLVRKSFPADSAPAQALIVFSRSSGLTDEDRAAVEGLREWFEGSGHPQAIVRYVTAERSAELTSAFRSSDGVVELARIDLRTAPFLPETNEAVDAVRDHLVGAGVLPAGLSAQVTGQAGIGRDYLAAIQEGTDRTTLMTILLVVIVLLLIYRAPLAALVPLITIGAAFLVSRGALGFLAQAGWQLSSVIDSFIVVLVFGVGTDYTIFLISRFREELARGSFTEALGVTVGRISPVIAASAATVIVGLCSMLVARFGMMQTIGPALALCIFITLLAGLTLTPALLAIFGRRLFWPRHEQTRIAGEVERGFWAGLARRITARPGLVAVIVLLGLAAPLVALPQFKQNFDVLDELPASAESRQGFVTLSDHLGEGQLMPLNVLVELPGGNLASQESLSKIAALQEQIAALPYIGSVRSVVDPMGEGRVSDLLKPALQLEATADGFRKAPSSDVNVQLGDASLAGIRSAVSYVGGLGGAFPQLAGSTALTGATTDLATLEQGLVEMRKQALVSNQLTSIADQLQGVATSGVTIDGSDYATELTTLQSYLHELAAAYPEVVSLESYQSAESALATLATKPDPLAFAGLVYSLRELSSWFEAQPAPVYFVPASIPPTAETLAAAQAMAAARARLPGELDHLAAAFGPNDLYAPAELLAAYESSSGSVTRLYVTTSTNPYDTRTFDTVHRLRELLTEQAASFGTDARTYVGGSTAEFADVQTTISEDFLRVAAITIIGILLVLILLLRALTAPIYLVLTVLLSYSASLSLATVLLQYVFGQSGVNYFIPLMVFVLLVALGSDYNIFLMSRVREESSTRPLRAGIRFASARTGTVITSAGMILAGTFAALITSPLQLLFQVGVTVALGVLIDTFIVRSLLVPAITAFVGERAWWPFHRRGA